MGMLRAVSYTHLVPTVLNGVDTGIRDPRDTYADASQWEEKAKDCLLYTSRCV